MDETKLNELKAFGKYYSVPKGKSMWPMLKSQENVVEIVPLENDLKQGDVALYYRSPDYCVLHRVVKVDKDEYIFCGDNCWQLEHVSKDNVLGVAIRFRDNNGWIRMDDCDYLRYVKKVPWLRRKAFIKALPKIVKHKLLLATTGKDYDNN